jgi:hypothetical protein
MVHPQLLRALALLAVATHAAAHANFCRSCADRAAALLVGTPANTALPRLEDASPQPAPVVVTPFALSEVSLRAGGTTGSNLSWAAQHTNLDYLLMLPVGSMAYNFRNTTGLSTEGAKPLGGWETPYPSAEGDDRGHFSPKR